MAARNINYYLLKVLRISGWLLLALMLIYIVTGFALCDKWGMSQWIDARTALLVHQVFDWPLVVIFSVHACATVYFAMRRWGWIPTGKKR